MGLFSQIVYGFTEFVRRNPVTCLVILILAVGAPSVLVGIANFIFYAVLTLVLMVLALVLYFRYRINRLRREMEQQGGAGPQRQQQQQRSYARRGEGDVKVFVTSETPEKRVNDSVGEYVEFEEVKGSSDKK